MRTRHATHSRSAPRVARLTRLLFCCVVDCAHDLSPSHSNCLDFSQDSLLETHFCWAMNESIRPPPQPPREPPRPRRRDPFFDAPGDQHYDGGFTDPNGTTTSPFDGGSLSPSEGGDGQSSSTDTTGRASGDQLTGLVRIATANKYDGAQAAGTGMVLTSNGEVVTNHHVVAGATSIEVKVMSAGHDVHRQSRRIRHQGCRGGAAAR